MAAFGFNTNVESNGEIYHVQTEPRRAAAGDAAAPPVIETAVFQRGLVQYVRRGEPASSAVAGSDAPGGDIETQLRAQHGAVIADLRAGRLRGHGPPLDLDWTTPPSASAPGAAPVGAGGELRLQVAIRCAQQPAPGCRIAAALSPESAPSSAAPIRAETQTDARGLALLVLPTAGLVPPLLLSLEAERGLSLAARQFRISG